MPGTTLFLDNHTIHTSVVKKMNKALKKLRISVIWGIPGYSMFNAVEGAFSWLKRSTEYEIGNRGFFEFLKDCTSSKFLIGFTESYGVYRNWLRLVRSNLC